MTMGEPLVSSAVDVRAVARHIIALDAQRPAPALTPLQLQSILCLAQAHYLAATGLRLFDEPIEAFEHGPGVARIQCEYAACGSQVIAEVMPDAAVGGELPADAARFVDAVWALYGEYSESALRRQFHSQRPWMDHFVDGAHRTVIPDDSMRDCFRSLPAEARVEHPDVFTVEAELLDQLDAREDEIVERIAAALA